MQSKGVIKLLAILLAIACIYQLSFSLKARSVEKKAAEYAAKVSESDSLRQAAEIYYLDSVQNRPVYDLGFISFTYKEVKEKEINLGLDLKGGMNVMLEVQVEDVLKALAGDSAHDPMFEEAIARANKALKEGTNNYIGEFAKAYREVSGGAPLAALFVSPDRKDITPNSSDSEVEKILQEETDAAIDASFNILRSRIDHFGVTQPNIQRLPNSHRILVELPGVKEPERVRKLLQGTASLEFWTTYNNTELVRALEQADQLLRDELAAGATDAAVEETLTEEQPTAAGTEDTTESLIAEVQNNAPAAEEAASASGASRYTREENPLFSLLNPYDGGGAVVGSVAVADTATVAGYLRMDAVRELLPSDVRFEWGIKGEPQNNGRFSLYALKVSTPDGKAPLDGSVIVDARETYAERGAAATVSMSMNSEGIQDWARLTGDNIGRCIAIVLDGYVYSAPVVKNKIEGGSSEISGNFTIQEAKDLANVLKSGKVPAPARIIQDTVVGPSLGQESINAGMMSFVIAFVLVLLYMLFFYNTAGLVANIALVTNLFFLFGVLTSFGAVLTLPGLAGIVLTMGMAVDANVIIYERVKEEIKAGKGLSLSIADGFKNAYSAIIDGNVTTLLTGIVLFIFGTGPVQGFATTLIIGILTSLFSSIFITRLLIEAIVAKFGHISFSRKWSENWLNNIHFDFVGKRKYSYAISGTVIVLSFISFAVFGLNRGVEFTGGRSYVVLFDQPVSVEQVRASVEDQFAQIENADNANVSLEIKQYGGDGDQVRIVTQYKYDDASDEATDEINRLLYDAVKKYYKTAVTFADFRNTQLSPYGIVSADKIGPSIAKDMTYNAIYAVFFSLIAIGLYITLRFKKWQWATGATLSLAHDALIVIGLFSMLYAVMPFNLEINQAFIAAILTVIGYSINNTVVIFDRIREYIALYPKRSLRDNINNATSSTMARTFNSSGTTLVTLVAIFLFGGETIRGFIFALLCGVAIGTYSSWFIATPLSFDLMPESIKNKGKE